MSELLGETLSRLSTTHYIIIAVNLLLLLLARPILERLLATQKGRQFEFKVNVLRGLNLAILAVVCYNALYAPSVASDEGGGSSLALRMLSILVVLYLAYLTASIASYVMRRRYGRVVTGNEGTEISDTYHSRMLTLLVSTFVAIVALIAIIRIAGFSSLLEAGGVVGFVGVFLALTQAAWAPDIISGLVLLNSDMVSEGDVIEIDDPPLLCRVFKTKIFHTVVIDVINNHRVMISNSRLREQTIHSLSKFASARGLRERLVFKIGYDTEPRTVRKMFEEAFQKVCELEQSKVDENHPPEIRVLDTGDHAIEWGFFYYTKNVQSLIATRQLLMETILNTSIEYGISLATPQTHVVTKQPAEHT
jgi:small-conductance mechanosensitive channel